MSGSLWSFSGKRSRKRKKNTGAAGKAYPKYFWTLPLFFYVFTVFSELVIRAGTLMSVWETGLLFVLFFSLPTTFLFWGLTAAFSRRANRALTSVIVAALTMLFCSQLIYYKVFHTFYILYSAVNGGQILQF